MIYKAQELLLGSETKRGKSLSEKEKGRTGDCSWAVLYAIEISSVAIILFAAYNQDVLRLSCD